MPITIKQAVSVWAGRWRNLKAWGRSLDNVTLVVRLRSEEVGKHSTGRCDMDAQRVVITASIDVVDSLGTVLHEFAHAAQPRRADRSTEPHDETWQGLYAAAVVEVTKISTVAATSNYKLMDRVVYDVMKTWWKRSGEERIWQLASGGK